MHPLLVALVLAAPPTASIAEQQAKAQQWDELYLGFGAVGPKGYSSKDQKRIGQALGRGCLALLDSDAVLASSLGEKSVAFFSEAPIVVCAARASLKGEERTAAEELLRAGLKRHPKDGPIAVELARLLIEEKDGKGAVAVLQKVPKRAPGYDDAQALLMTASAMAQEDAKAREALAGTGTSSPPAKDASSPVAIEVEVPRDGPPLPGARPPKFTESRSYESTTDDEGRRVRQNAYFRFRYFNAQRDFGQRADYEGRVQGALEEARITANRVLGVARETPTDVILYSKAEFTLHHGEAFAQTVAGFYSQSAIRMNDSAEINAHNQATLVHEYVHAVIDELTGFFDERLPIWVNEGLAEYTEWQYLGRTRPEGRYDSYLRQRAAGKSLPPLESKRSLIATDDPGLAYAYSAIAVRAYVARYGMSDLISLIRDVGKGTPFEKAFTAHTSSDLQSFTDSLRDEILAK